MRTFLILFLLFGLFQAEAQVVEVNPNINWSYVRTQNLELQSGRTYQFEVPAEKGYDYVFNLAHSQMSAFARINVVDLQYGPVSSIVDSLIKCITSVQPANRTNYTRRLK